MSVLLFTSLITFSEIKQKHEDGRTITIKESCEVKQSDEAAIVYFWSSTSPTISLDGLKTIVLMRLSSKEGRHIKRVFICIN